MTTESRTAQSAARESGDKAACRDRRTDEQLGGEAACRGVHADGRFGEVQEFRRQGPLVVGGDRFQRPGGRTSWGSASTHDQHPGGGRPSRPRVPAAAGRAATNSLRRIGTARRGRPAPPRRKIGSSSRSSRVPSMATPCGRISSITGQGYFLAVRYGPPVIPLHPAPDGHRGLGGSASSRGRLGVSG